MAKVKGTGDPAGDLIALVKAGTAKWTQARKSEKRDPQAHRLRSVRLTRTRMTQFKEAADEIMHKAYMQASGDGKYPAHARQLMYAARPHIQAATGRPLSDSYFTQTLLPDYVGEHGVAWDIVYDARGHLDEPHGGRTIGLGTIEVRDYLRGLRAPLITPARVAGANVDVEGPAGGFGAVLFIEKEGFAPLIEAAKIAERYDIAVMSTKGMSVVAARKLVDQMCSDHAIPLFVLHDFDKAGFSIAGTLQRDTRRYRFENVIDVVDIGLDLEQVTAMRLEVEEQYAKAEKNKLIDNMRLNGAGDNEIAFMFRDFNSRRVIRRVELNAMTSPQFVNLVETGLRARRVKKIVPQRKLLADTFTEMTRGIRLADAVKKIGAIDMTNVKVPADLERRVREALSVDPSMRWDAAVKAIVDAASKEAAG